MMSCSTLQEKNQTKKKAIPEREDCLRRNEELILQFCLKGDPGESSIRPSLISMPYINLVFL